MPESRTASCLLISAVLLWAGLAAAKAPQPGPSPSPRAGTRPAGALKAPAPGAEPLGGVVVVSVGRGSALEKAGLQPGDVIERWRRPPLPPANPEEASGGFGSPFDWLDVEVEQAQRGRLLLTGHRDEAEMTFTVEQGEWNTPVRPRLGPQALDLYARIAAALGEKDTARALSLWKRLDRQLLGFPCGTESDWLRHWLAGELWHRGDLRKGLSILEPAAGRSSCPPSHPEIQAAFLTLAGEILEQQGSPRKAEKRFLEALRLRKRPASPNLTEAIILSRLGTFYLYQGDLGRAEVNYRLAMDIRENQAPGSMDFASSVNNLGVLALERQNFSEALGYFRQALVVRSALAPGSSAEGQSLYNIGLVYGYLDDEQKSEEFLRRALKAFERAEPDSLQVAMTMNSLGVTYFDRQDLELGRFYYDQALAILKEVAPISLDTADTLTNLGYISFEEHDLGKAKRQFNEALRMQRKLAPGGRAVANNLNDLGITLAEIGDFPGSMAAHREALRVLSRIAPRGAETASNLYNIGVLYAERKKYPKAFNFFRRSLSLREKLIPDSHILAETYSSLGKVARESGDLAAAEDWYAKAMAVFERQILFLGAPRAGSVPLRSSREEIYRGAVSVASKKGDAKAVFELLERFRGAQLAEMISHHDETVFERLPKEVASQLRETQRQYEEISLRLEGLSGREVGEKAGVLVSRLSELQRRFSELIDSARNGSVDFFDLRYPRPVGSSALMRQLELGSGQGLLYFFVMDGEVWSLLVLDGGRTYLRHHLLNERDLKGKIARLRSLAQSSPRNSVLAASDKVARLRVGRELYDALIGPVEALLTPLDRLLIIPDGPLHLLPWNALIRGAITGGGGFQYLTEWKPLHLVPSATVYAGLQQNRPKIAGSGRDSGFVAFADPETPVEGGEVEPRRPSEIAPLLAVRRRVFDQPRLLFSRQEVEGIARLFPPASSRIYLGGDATEERVLAMSGEAHILHFATHAYLDDRFPLNSALVLSMPAGLPEGRENGLLQVWEIFARVRLHADLVVLSACETALGEEQGGEGLLGLTRAFQHAGARTVLASLWSVNDQATSELMIRFYKHLRAGMPKDLALQAAQRELIAGPIEVTNEKGEREIHDWSAPYYWAGFQLYGDWQ